MNKQENGREYVFHAEGLNIEPLLVDVETQPVDLARWYGCEYPSNMAHWLGMIADGLFHGNRDMAIERELGIRVESVDVGPWVLV